MAMDEKKRLKKKRQLIEVALMYWASHANPTRLDVELLSEIAFEENYKQLLFSLPTEVRR